jgi:hypothetical protein
MGSQVMTEAVRAKQVYEVLRHYVRNRPDVGLGRAIRDGIFESPNPFDGKAARPPKRWFVLSCLLAAVGFGFFFYFNKLL